MALNFANNNSLSAITTKPSGLSGGAMNLISTQTASSSSTISFTSGIDDTYDEYVFKFYDIHPATDQASFQVNFRDGGSSYDATKTTTNFRAYHNEAGSDQSLGYFGDEDLAQSTAVQIIGRTVGNGNDECFAGTLRLFNPSSTTFVKHYMSNCNAYQGSNAIYDTYAAGYGNTTSAVDAIQFSMSSGNIDAGDICLYGIL